MKITRLKIYEIPQMELLLISSDDVLTLSNGFDGEDHEFQL